jgi:hypothetical protein
LREIDPIDPEKRRRVEEYHWAHFVGLAAQLCA